MENIEKHIVENQRRTETAYWDTYHNLEKKKNELMKLQHDVIWMEKDLEKQDSERKYFQKLLDELNNSHLS